MMNSDLYDLIRYQLVPPAFLFFFTVIPQVSKKNSLMNALVYVQRSGHSFREKVLLYVRV